MQIQKLIYVQTTGFHLGRSSEQSASLYQAGIIHLGNTPWVSGPKKVGTEVLWGVDGVDMDWRKKAISTCQVMHFATLCPRVFVIVSCLVELCPQSLSLSLCFLPQIPIEQYKLFSPHSDPRAVSGGGHTQRWHGAKDFFLFSAAVSSLGAVCLWSRGVWPSLPRTLPSSLSRAGPVAAGAG